MTDCIFCKIAEKKVPAHTIYEDDNTLAFLDIYPHAKGHTVVIPKGHGETAFDFSDEQNRAVMSAAVKVMKKLKVVLSPVGFNVGWNHGFSAGQVVPHLHLHVLPRYENDGGGSIHSIIKNPGETSVDDVAKLFG